VNGASFEASRPVAPGAVAALFGEFAGVTPATAQGFVLPEILGEVSVSLDGRAAGLYSVLPTQINFQVPLDFPAGIDPKDVEVRVSLRGAVIATTGIFVRDVSPAMFVADANHETRPAIALNPDGTLNSQQNPARPGETLRLYLSGQGDNLVGPALGPVATIQTPLVHFRLWKGETIFSGLPAAGVPGLWVVDVRIPEAEDLPDGATPVRLVGVASAPALGPGW
jgi:uncharacterized protein (TIGR03437 family)